LFNPFPLAGRTTDDVIGDAREISRNGVRFRLPSLSDQLLHCFFHTQIQDAHGFVGRFKSRYVVDTLALLSACSDDEIGEVDALLRKSSYRRVWQEWMQICEAAQNPNLTVADFPLRQRLGNGRQAFTRWPSALILRGQSFRRDPARFLSLKNWRRYWFNKLNPSPR